MGVLASILAKGHCMEVVVIPLTSVEIEGCALPVLGVIIVSVLRLTSGTADTLVFWKMAILMVVFSLVIIAGL